MYFELAGHCGLDSRTTRLEIRGDSVGQAVSPAINLELSVRTRTHPPPRPEGAAVPSGNFSYPDFTDVRARNRTFESVAVYQSTSYTATGIGPALHVEVENVSSNLFDLLGTRPVLGRTFLPEE